MFRTCFAAARSDFGVLVRDLDGLSDGMSKSSKSGAIPCKRKETAAEYGHGPTFGRVSERLKEPVLKTGVPKGTVGSNPTPTV